MALSDKSNAVDQQAANLVVKSQAVRLADVFVIGPIMIYGATKISEPTWLKWALGLFGASTILYNAQNYVMVDESRGIK
jgi:hypothetical protein